MSVAELRTEADEAIDEALKARADGNPETVIDQYTSALEKYQMAKARAIGDTKAEIEATIERLQADRDELRSIQAVQSSFRESLQAAEESFRQAIIAHADGEYTLSRIRYRQARTEFENALNKLEHSETALLETPINISIDTDGTLESRQLRTIPGIKSETVKSLDELGIETVGDLRKKTETVDVVRIDRKAAIQELDIEGPVDEETATKLTALSWSCETPNQNFSKKNQIDKRKKQATIGFDAS